MGGLIDRIHLGTTCLLPCAAFRLHRCLSRPSLSTWSYLCADGWILHLAICLCASLCATYPCGGLKRVSHLGRPVSRLGP